MGCCDDDGRQTTSMALKNSNSHDDADDSNGGDGTNEEQPNPPEEHEHDLWAVSEGYTPLADLDANDPYNTSGSVMVSFGADNVEHEGAFFVNPSAMMISSDCDAREQDNADQGNENGNEANLGERDFHSIADNALRILDEEYQRTLRGERPPRWSEQQTSSTERAVRTSPSTGSETDESKTEDLETIVAAFDKRKDQIYDLNPERSSGGGGGSFDVDWGGIPSPATSSDRLPPVDTDAIRKAVTNISLKADGTFQQKFAVWQGRQKRSDGDNDTHELIPKAPFRAFLRSTDKAKQSSKALSRSATIAEAMVRLADKNLLDTSKDFVSIHIIGSDHVECESTGRIQFLFRPLVRWLGVWSRCQSSKLSLRLNGRDLIENSPKVNRKVDLLTPDTTKTSRLSEAFATVHGGNYDEWLENEKPELPDLVIAFNAGKFFNLSDVLRFLGYQYR